MKLEEEILQPHFKNDRHKAIVNIFYTYNWLYEKHVQQFKPHGVTFQQFNILRILRGQHPCPSSVKQLKERMLDKMSDVSRLVEKLRVKGLVERASCTKDRRSVDVVITQKGLDLLAKLDENEETLLNLTSSLSETELETLNDYLDRMRG